MPTLLVTPFTPRENTGRGLRTIGVARALARSDDVEVAYVEFDGAHPSELLRAEPRVSLHRLEASRGARRALSYAHARLAGTPPDYARGVSRELVTAGRAWSHPHPRRLIADGPISAAALLLVARAPRVHYLAHNVESLLGSALLDSTSDAHPTDLRAFEKRIMTAACETWLPTSRDVEDAAGIAPGASFRHVPNVLDVQAIAPVAPAGGNRILFVGDFSYEPNRNAVDFLVHHVMPELWASAPQATLVLVGRSPSIAADVDPRVEALGFVEDLRVEYERAACAVVPLLQAGGSQLKFIEALAYGIPVVATPLAASRLEGGVAGVHFLEAEEPAAFARALAVLLGAPDSEMGQRGRALVEERYSIEALAAGFTERGEEAA